jgi:hypothetical protein
MRALLEGFDTVMNSDDIALPANSFDELSHYFPPVPRP